MAHTPNVSSGFWQSWVDHSQPPFQRRQFTFSNKDAGIWTNFVAVDLTLAIPLVFVLFQRLIEVLWTWIEGSYKRYRDRKSREAVGDPAADSTRLLDDRHLQTDTESTSTRDPTANNTQSLESLTNLPSDTFHDAEENRRHNDGQNESNIILNSEDMTTAETTNPSAVTSGSDHQIADVDVETGVVDIETADATRKPTSREIFLSKKTPQAAAAKLTKTVLEELIPRKSRKSTSPRNWKKIVFCSVLLLVCMVLFGSLTYATIASADIASGNVVSSTSPDCGIWILDPVFTFLSPFNYLREAESGDVAKRCYGKNVAVGECNDYFFEPSLPIKEAHRTTCPFAEGFCLEGNRTSYKLSTGLINSQTLGINVPIGYTFNRTTTCAPVLRAGYVSIDQTRGMFDYHYGRIAGISDRTWSTPFYPDRWDSGYSVETFCNSSSTGLGWQPLDEFQAASDKLVTLLLITSKGNLHFEERKDPIFPARTIVRVGSDFLYYNSDPIATVMACSDQTNICDATGQNCWGPREDPPAAFDLPGRVEKDGYYILQAALLRSWICHSIKYRGGNALDAQTKLNIYFSLPLPKEQWKVEARNLFAASLARIQIDLRDYARGSAAKEPGFINYMDPEFQGICKLYKFRGIGYTNLSFWPFTWLLLGSVVIFIMSFKRNVKEEVGGKEIIKRKFLIEIILVWFYNFVSTNLNGGVAKAGLVVRKAKSLVQERLHRRHVQAEDE